jgi:hypothetical protein
MVTLRLALKVTGTKVPGVTTAPVCWTPTLTALNVVGAVLQRLEKVNLREVPPTATVAMSRVVELVVTPLARSVGEVQVVCQAGGATGEAVAEEKAETDPTAIRARTPRIRMKELRAREVPVVRCARLLVDVGLGGVTGTSLRAIAATTI